MSVIRPAIDLIYLWVDGSDPVWLEKKNRFLSLKYDDSETHNKGRYANNDELRYALRSVEKHAPWVRNIYIVTDNQQPSWLNTAHPKIHLIDHQDIFPPNTLPSYNSCVIEYFLYKIPGLSEQFLYANDDMFLNADLSPEFFFGKDGCPIVRLKRSYLGKFYYTLKNITRRGLGQYAHTVHKAALLVEKKFGKYYAGKPHHNIDSYLLSDYKAVMSEVFVDQVRRTQTNRTRSKEDLQRSVVSFYALARGRAHLQYVGRKTSSRILLHRHNFDRYMKKYQPKLFCLNDSQRNQDHHRKMIVPLLAKRFPIKSAFEL